MAAMQDSTALVRHRPSPLAAALSAQDVEVLRLQAVVIAAGELMRCNNRAAAEADTMTKLIAAWELGLPPVITAATNMHIIEGRLTLSAKCQLALVRRSGLVSIDVVERSEERCEILFSRIDSGDTYRSVITMEEAKRRGLTAGRQGPKTNWANHPAHMLFARAVTDGLGVIASDITGGLYAPEDFGYTDETVHTAPYEDQDAPLGADWAKAFIDRCKRLPKQQAVLEALRDLKAKLLGSADYKLQAVPARHREDFEEWVAGLEEAAGERIGLKAAQSLHERVKQVAAKTGADHDELHARCQEVAAKHGLTSWADLTALQAQEIVDLLVAAMKTREAERVPWYSMGPSSTSQWREFCASRGWLADVQDRILYTACPAGWSEDDAELAKDLEAVGDVTRQLAEGRITLDELVTAPERPPLDEPAEGSTGRLREPRPDDTGTHAHATDTAAPVLQM